MADYFIIPDLSEMKPGSMWSEKHHRETAIGLGRYFLAYLELEKHIPPQVKKMVATVFPDRTGEVKEVFIEPVESRMTEDQLEGILRRLESEHLAGYEYGLRTDEFNRNNLSFTLRIGTRDVKFCIMPYLISYHESRIEDIEAFTLPRPKIEPKTEPDKSMEPPMAEMQIATATAMPRTLPATIDELTGYDMAGERDSESALDLRGVLEASMQLNGPLHATIAHIETGTGANPKVLYTRYSKDLKVIDVMPPEGTTITQVELSNAAIPADTQVRGVIAYSYGPLEFRVHRRHIHEKFDVRGLLYTDHQVKGKIIRTPPDQTAAIREALRALPVRINISDDSEATVAYNSDGTIFVCPKDAAEISMPGYEEAREKRVVLEKGGSNKDAKRFSIEQQHRDGKDYMFLVFKNSRRIIAEAQEEGLSEEKDAFDEFYDRHVQKQGKNTE